MAQVRGIYMMDWIAGHFNNMVDMLSGPEGVNGFIRVLEFIGTFAGAISGVRLASVKRFDWFGASVIGFITACGGGTLRDMLLRVEPFWMSDPFYIGTTGLAVVAVGLFGRKFVSGQITWFVFDTISISVFTIIGLQKAVLHGYDSWWCATLLGVVTAVVGGIMRDICINEVPLIFRKELYALACTAGGLLYFLLPHLGVESVYAKSVAGTALIFAIRALAIRFHLGVPVMSGHGAAFHHHHHHHAQEHQRHRRDKDGGGRSEAKPEGGACA